MTAQHPSRGWKGCCMLCTPWIRGDGKRHRMKVGDLRRAGGRRVVKRKQWADA